jgi:6-phosphogluconolactonase (cycloisomerase 2 family)
MRVKSGWALLCAVISLLLFNRCSNSTNVTVGSGIVWVATTGDQKINTYTLNESSGAGSRVGSGSASGAQPVAMVMTPDRKLLFVANVDDTCGSSSQFCNRVRAFTVNTDGTLAALGNPVQIGATSGTPQGMAMGLGLDPTGKLLFVVNQGNSGVLGQAGSVPGSISIFNISSSTAPAPVPNSPFSSKVPGDVIGNGPSAVAVSPVGHFVYVANQFTNTVAAFAYDATMGSLGFIASHSTGTNPAALAFSRCAGGNAINASCTATDGNNLFVANSGASNNVNIFTACIQATPACTSANGTLQEVSGSPVSANGIGPASLIVHPQLNFVYIVDKQSNEVSQFAYNSANGLLTALSPATISTGTSPVSGGITSNGNMVIVPSSGGSDLAVFRVDSAAASAGAAPTGRLARASTPSITLSAQPSSVVVK